MRHLFITRCMELNINVRVIADWVGHNDGGALILKRYFSCSACSRIGDGQAGDVLESATLERSADARGEGCLRVRQVRVLGFSNSAQTHKLNVAP